MIGAPEILMLILMALPLILVVVWMVCVLKELRATRRSMEKLVRNLEKRDPKP